MPERRLAPPEASGARFFYGYVIVAAALLIDLLMAGVHFTFGIFFKPVSGEFGWTRAATAGAFTFYNIFHGALFILTGRISDRFGPKPMLVASGIFFGAGLILMSTINSIWQLYLYYGVLVSIGMSGGFVPLLSTVARWFDKRRGLMTGLVLAGGGVGQALFPPVTTWLISRYEWRASYVIVGVMILVLIVGLAQVLRRDPRDIGRLPYGAEERSAGGPSSSKHGLSLRQAASTGQFWQYWLAIILTQFGVGTMVVHAVPHGIDLGMSAAAAAGVVTLFAGVGVLARILLGAGIDRVGDTRVMASMCFLLTVAFLGIAITRQVWAFYLFAAVFGIAFGGFVSTMSPLAAQLFGLSSHGVIFGVASFGAALGGGIGPLVAGAVFDGTGSYGGAFWGAAGLSLVAFVIVLFLRPVKGGREIPV